MNMTTKFALANSEIISNKCASIISFFWLTGNSVSNFKEFLFNRNWNSGIPIGILQNFFGIPRNYTRQLRNNMEFQGITLEFRWEFLKNSRNSRNSCIFQSPGKIRLRLLNNISISQHKRKTIETNINQTCFRQRLFLGKWIIKLHDRQNKFNQINYLRSNTLPNIISTIDSLRLVIN
jgi:hypothetical protein